MDFEDRLRNQLQGQSNNIHVELDNPGAVAQRSAVRSKRRAVGVPLAALALAGIIGGGVWASLDQGGSSESVAVVGDETLDESADNSADEAATDGDADAKPVDLEHLITQGFAPGPELILEDISSENSPGGWGPIEVKSDGGIYYVLSTAPGEPQPPELEQYSYQRADTLYRYDGTGWAISDFGDRLVADFDSNAGVLYAVSTGTTNDVSELALGQSTDQGQSWAWKALPTDGLDPAKLSPRFATKGDTVVVVSQLPTFRYFEAGAELARSAGLDVHEYDLLSVNATGIGYLEPQADADPCAATEREFWNSIEREFVQVDEAEDFAGEGFAVEGPVSVGPVGPEGPVSVGPGTVIPFPMIPGIEGPDAESLEAMEASLAAAEAEYVEQERRLFDALREAGCEQEATCRQINSDFYNDPDNQVSPNGFEDFESLSPDELDAVNAEFEQAFDEQLVKLDELLIAGGCEHEVTCRKINESFYDDGLMAPPFEPPIATQSDMTEEEIAEYERQWEVFIEQSDAWQAENRERLDQLYAQHEAELVAAGCFAVGDMEPPNPKFVEWSSLGVVPPADWKTSMVQAVGPAGTQVSELDIGSYVIDVTVDGDEFVIVAADDAFNYTFDEQPNQIEWRSVDGIDWTRTDGALPDFYSSATVNGQRFTIDWSDYEGPVIQRSVAGAEGVQEIELRDLAPELPDGLVVNQISGGSNGVVIVAAEQTYSRAPELFYVLFSPDGIRWSVQELPSGAHLPGFNSDSLLLFGFQDDGASEGPTPVYLGRVNE